MHGVFVQMVIILLFVALADLIIILYNAVHDGPHIFIIPKRHVPVMGVHKYLCLQQRVLRLINIETDTALIKISKPPLKILQCMFHRIENMAFPLGLRHGVPGNGILQAPQLGACIPAKGLGGAFGQEQVPVVQKFLSKP